jgi:hypothetical protein
MAPCVRGYENATMQERAAPGTRLAVILDLRFAIFDVQIGKRQSKIADIEMELWYYGT